MTEHEQDLAEVVRLANKNSEMRQLIKELTRELEHLAKVFMPSEQWEGVQIHDDAWNTIDDAKPYE